VNPPDFWPTAAAMGNVYNYQKDPPKSCAYCVANANVSNTDSCLNWWVMRYRWLINAGSCISWCMNWWVRSSRWLIMDYAGFFVPGR
jgi:hypothetical protein